MHHSPQLPEHSVQERDKKKRYKAPNSFFPSSLEEIEQKRLLLPLFTENSAKRLVQSALNSLIQKFWA